jgi:catechol 2,3-dioxygenase-like lactoylglutathione lyase family enzyme
VTVTALDHVALPTADAERFLAFYKRLGFRIAGEEDWRAGRARTFALVFGPNRINVHPETLAVHRGESWYLVGDAAVPGSADLCFVWEGGVDRLLDLLAELRIEPLTGPVERSGGRGPGRSVYIRDPDGNLLEFISYEASDLQRHRSA